MTTETKTALGGVGMCITGAICLECGLKIVGPMLIVIGAGAILVAPFVGVLFKK